MASRDPRRVKESAKDKARPAGVNAAFRFRREIARRRCVAPSENRTVNGSVTTKGAGDRRNYETHQWHEDEAGGFQRGSAGAEGR